MGALRGCRDRPDQGFYSTIVGAGVLIGNLAVGSLMSPAHRVNTDEMIWNALILVGIVDVRGLYRLDRGSARPASGIIECEVCAVA
jgi:hypothetical protein